MTTRVLMVGHTSQLGGNEIGTARLIKAMGQDEFEVVALLFEDGPFAQQLREQGVEVHIRPLPERVREAKRGSAGRFTSLATLGPTTIAHAGGVVRWMRSQDIDVLWANTFKAMAITTPATRLLRIPTVWSLHDRIAPDYLPGRVVGPIRAAFRSVPDVVVANSVSTAQTVGGNRPITVVHPGLVPGQDRLRESAPSGPPIIGMLGRISPTKGQLQLVRALPQVLETHPDVQVRIVGNAMFGARGYEAAVRAEAAKLGVADAIEWVGFVSEPGPELDRMTVCVHAATVPEPFGQVIVQAMARCVPVIATRGGGAEESVAPEGHEERGTLVAPGNVDELRDALLRTLADPAAAQRRAISVQPLIRSEYSIAHSARCMGEALRLALNA